MVLGGLRYDKNDLAALLGKVGAMLTQEMIEESSFYRMVLEKGMEKGIQRGMEKGIEKGIEKGMEKGIEKGIQKGMEKGLEKGMEKGIETGRIEEARRNLRRVLALRFPALGDLPELDAIQDPGRLEKLLDVVVTARDPGSVRAAVQKHSKARWQPQHNR